jgi:hypothetical protein
MGKGKAWSRDDQVITVPLNKELVSILNSFCLI